MGSNPSVATINERSVMNEDASSNFSITEEIGWSDKDREEARSNPLNYPESLRYGLNEALQEVHKRKIDNYENPIWEPVIGYLEQVIRYTFK